MDFKKILEQLDAVDSTVTKQTLSEAAFAKSGVKADAKKNKADATTRKQYFVKLTNAKGGNKGVTVMADEGESEGEVRSRVARDHKSQGWTVSSIREKGDAAEKAAAGEKKSSVTASGKRLGRPPGSTKKVTEGRQTVSEYIAEARLMEKSMSPEQKGERERIVKGMKKSKDSFEKRYPGRGEAVMYATATKRAVKESYLKEDDSMMGMTIDQAKQHPAYKTDTAFKADVDAAEKFSGSLSADKKPKVMTTDQAKKDPAYAKDPAFKARVDKTKPTTGMVVSSTGQQQGVAEAINETEYPGQLDTSKLILKSIRHTGGDSHPGSPGYFDGPVYDNSGQYIGDLGFFPGGKLSSGNYSWSSKAVLSVKNPRDPYLQDYWEKMGKDKIGNGNFPLDYKITDLNDPLMKQAISQVEKLKQGVAEGAKCNHTMEGEECPVHGLDECGTYMEESQFDEDLNQMKKIAGVGAVAAAGLGAHISGENAEIRAKEVEKLEKQVASEPNSVKRGQLEKMINDIKAGKPLSRGDIISEVNPHHYDSDVDYYDALDAEEARHNAKYSDEAEAHYADQADQKAYDDDMFEDASDADSDISTDWYLEVIDELIQNNRRMMSPSRRGIVMKAVQRELALTAKRDGMPYEFNQDKFDEAYSNAVGFQRGVGSSRNSGWHVVWKDQFDPSMHDRIKNATPEELIRMGKEIDKNDNGHYAMQLKSAQDELRGLAEDSYDADTDISTDWYLEVIDELIQNNRRMMSPSRRNILMKAVQRELALTAKRDGMPYEFNQDKFDEAYSNAVAHQRGVGSSRNSGWHVVWKDQFDPSMHDRIKNATPEELIQMGKEIDKNDDGHYAMQLKSAQDELRGLAEDSSDEAEYSDEVGMVENNLETIERAAEELDSILQDGEDLPEWVEEKVSNAKAMLVSAKEYMASQHANGDVHHVDDEELAEGIGSMIKRGVKKIQGTNRVEKAYTDHMNKSATAVDQDKELARARKALYVGGAKTAEKAYDQYHTKKYGHAPNRQQWTDDEMDESNEFIGALAKARAAHKDSFEVDGKTYPVKESRSAIDELAECYDMAYQQAQAAPEQKGGMSVSANTSTEGTRSLTVNAEGDMADELAQLLSLSGLVSGRGHQEEMDEGAADEFHANTRPEPTTFSLSRQLNTGGDLNRPKTQHPAAAARGDNPLTR